MMNDPIKACVFDAYGTLFDVHSAVGRHAELVGKDALDVSKLWRTKQLEYSWVHTLMRRHADFWELTGAALDYALAFYKINDEKLKRTLRESYLALNAYSEVPGVLQELRAAGLKTAVLSNGSPFMLERAVGSAGLAGLLDECLSIEDVRIYKPDAAAYQIATAALSVQPSEVAFFSSNAWDAIGAHTFGFRAFWVNRSKQPEEYGLYRKATVLSSLQDGVGRLTSKEERPSALALPAAETDEQ
jgi:2-haloacid dehalogenase